MVIAWYLFFDRLNTATVSDAQLPAMPTINFYGKVIDEAGLPVVDAQVYLSAWKVPPGWSSRNGSPLRDVVHETMISTESDGTFELANEKGYMLQILDIRKVGYDWLIDRDWSWPTSNPARGHPDNRFFIYGGGFPFYIPDPDHPAVFPLYRKGAQGTSILSRRGSDRLEDGQVIRNEPTQPAVPSTGPGSPATAIESIERVRKLHRPTTSTQSTK
jgi:hypothetical protein